MPKYDCGCVNVEDSQSGVLKCLSKCDFHVKWAKDHPQGESRHYFIETFALDKDGNPQFDHYAPEFMEGFGDFVDPFGQECGSVKSQTMLEIGCGLGQYIPFFLSHGWKYIGLEPASYARNWANKTFYAPILPTSFEKLDKAHRYDMIFAAHVFEHMPDCPGAIRKCFQMLRESPRGELWLIVPDDTDPTNPDHLWFFTPETLRNLLVAVGFEVVGLRVKQFPLEKYIYCAAKR